jgi:plastocyanin
MKLRALVVLLAMLGLTAGSLTASGEAATSTDHQVSIVDFSFMPNRLAVRVGDTVTWTNNGAVSHTSTSRTWDSGVLSPGESFALTFNSTGRFLYRCSIHTNMRGGIKVRP